MPAWAAAGSIDEVREYAAALRHHRPVEHFQLLEVVLGREALGVPSGSRADPRALYGILQETDVTVN